MQLTDWRVLKRVPPQIRNLSCIWVQLLKKLLELLHGPVYKGNDEGNVDRLAIIFWNPYCQPSRFYTIFQGHDVIFVPPKQGCDFMAVVFFQPTTLVSRSDNGRPLKQGSLHGRAHLKECQ